MSRRLSVSVPDDLAEALDSLAERSGRTKSEVVRDALRRQVQRGRLAELQAYGREQAEARGVGPEEGGPLVDELHAEGTVRPGDRSRYLPKPVNLRGTGKTAADYVGESRR